MAKGLLSGAASVSSGEFYVYCYYKPDGTPFYVGKGKGDRHKYHIKEATNHRASVSNPLKTNTIKKIFNEKQKPLVKFIDTNLSEERAFELEEFLISEIGRLNLKTGPLTNLTNGGEGRCGYVYTEEQKQAISTRCSGSGNPNYGKTKELSAWWGKKHRLETKLKISKAQKGKKFSQEHINNMRKPKSEQGRLAIAQARKNLTLDGYKPSVESNKKRSSTLMGRVFSDDHKQKISQSLRGKPKKITTCPFCLKVGAVGIMKRWHFNNCRDIKHVSE